MTGKTFTAPSGTEFAYQVGEDGRPSKNDLVTWADDTGQVQYLRGADLIALAIHWIEGDLTSLRAKAVHGPPKVWAATCMWCANSIQSEDGQDGTWRNIGLLGSTVCVGSYNDLHEPCGTH